MELGARMVGRQQDRIADLMTGGEFRLLESVSRNMRELALAIDKEREGGSLPSHLKAVIAELAEINDELRRDGPAFEDSTGAIVYRSGRRWMPRAIRNLQGEANRIEWFEVDPLPGGKRGGRG